MLWQIYLHKYLESPSNLGVCSLLFLSLVASHVCMATPNKRTLFYSLLPQTGAPGPFLVPKGAHASDTNILLRTDQGSGLLRPWKRNGVLRRGILRTQVLSSWSKRWVGCLLDPHRPFTWRGGVWLKEGLLKPPTPGRPSGPGLRTVMNVDENQFPTFKLLNLKPGSSSDQVVGLA